MFGLSGIIGGLILIIIGGLMVFLFPGSSNYQPKDMSMFVVIVGFIMIIIGGILIFA